jgi:MFS transporter, NNP family, nitrate/nitrite transporter
MVRCSSLSRSAFPREIGVMTGLVGAAGGLGGFILPNVLGVLRGLTGSFSGGFLVFAMAGYLCAALLATISSSWEQGFVGRGGLAAEST